MIKHVPGRLLSWWYATMVPEQSPALTIEEREQVRKRRLFSLIVLFHSLVVASWLPIKSAAMYQQAVLATSLCFFLLSLFINKWGYLKIASVCYMLSAFLLLSASIVNLSPAIPSVIIGMWPALLSLLVIGGLLLPGWGSLVMGGILILFMSWFVLVEGHRQMATFMPDSADRFMFLFFSSMVILLIAVLSAISSTITKKAVVQADRAVELEQAYQKISDAYAIIQRQALTDGLTDLPNHRAVVEQLGKEMERARRHSRPFSLLFFDADRFKHINDTYGHAAGDTVLRQISERAACVLRKEDTLGRFGGEEFVVLLPESDLADAESAAERIRAAIATSPVAIPEAPAGINITVSIGLSTYPVDGDHGEILLTAADEAMYIAKRMGRNQVRTAEEARRMQEDAELMALLESEKQRDAAQREGLSLEHLREGYTLKMVSSLTSLLERRDENMRGHAHCVSDLATTIAQQMQLNDKEVSHIGMAALLHDIGKIGIPDAILQKTGVLSFYEETLLKDHAELGAQILEASPFSSDLAPLVRYHHERWDGRGYPQRLAGEDIPLAARIIAVAETYDSLQRDYPYQKQCSTTEALLRIQEQAGLQFDPDVVRSLSMLVVNSQTLEMVLQGAK